MFLILLFSSCNKEEELGSDKDSEFIEEEIEFELTEFLWKKMIDRPTYPRKYHSYYPFIYEGKVIFNNWQLEGYVAMDLETGEEIWNNRGQTNSERLPAKPIKVKNKIYTIKASGLREINLDNGEIEVGYLWPVSNEYMDYEFNIDNNTLYADVHEFANAVTFSGWVSCPLDRLEEQEWTYFDRQFMINNHGYQRHLAAPVFFEKPNGEKLMIHFSVYADLGFQNEYFKIEAYNLDKGEPEWVNENSTGGSLLIPYMEDNKIYFTDNKVIHCVDAGTGKTLWRTAEGSLDQLNAAGSMVPYKNSLIVMCRDGRTVAIDKEDGQIIWEQPFEGWEAQLYHKGADPHTANIYNDRLYYVSAWGRLISMDPNNGSYRSFMFPQFETDEELELELFEQDFNDSHIVISEDGIIYTADGIRFLAFEVPDKDM
mgnify:CR=1 FL=1